MQMIDYKPLGTVVKIEGNDKRFLITGRAISVPMKKGEAPKLFDYSAVFYPEGLGTRPIFFQDSDISEVVFIGYTDEEDKTVIGKLKEYLEKLGMERASKEDYKGTFKK